ncbi:MAG TPA: POTRA domain-containing protein [Terriglobia bacterium]|nr:POTRA domain-containing protein [Terriglobia bacterium]
MAKMSAGVTGNACKGAPRAILQSASLALSLRRRLRFSIVALGCVFLSVLCAAPRAGAQEAQQLWGKIVHRVELRTDSALRVSNFTSQIIQKTGTPLDAAQVDQSLKNLYATGRFITLSAGAIEDQGGMILVFTGKARFFVGRVSARETSKALPVSALLSSARLALGAPLALPDLETATQNMQSLLKSSSYYQSRIRYAVARNPSDQVADITFTVDPGPPAKLSAVEFSGKTNFPAARLQSVAGWKRGTVLDPAKVQHGLYEIRRFYSKRGYLEVVANEDRAVYDAKTGTVRLLVKINSGPVVRVHVEGAKMSASQITKTLPVLFVEGLTDDLSLDAGAKDLGSYFERKGYFSAQAKWRRIVHPGETDITYAVDLGKRSAFESFDFKGNHSISSDDLTPLVTIQTEKFLTHPHGIFNQQMLNQDVGTLTSYYHSKGFLQAHITPHQYMAEGEMAVTFIIDEGPMTRVHELAFQGVDATAIQQFRPSLQALPGRPYSPQIINHDRDSILTYFGDHGFNEATVALRVSNLANHQVNVNYDIHPGARQKVERVVVLGNQHTRTGVINRQITLKPGDPLSQAQVYESQRKLYDLGLFSSVQILPLDPAGIETDKTVLVNVQEADRWTLGYGFGLDVQRLGGNQPAGQLSASPRLSLSATRIDVGGRDQTFSFRGRVSDLETGAETSYLFSHFLNKPSLSLHFDLLGYQTRDVLTFTSRLEQASLTLEKQLSPSTFLLGRYNYRRVSLYDVHLAPEEVPLVSQPVQDAGFESTWIHDTRDDPADATRGSYSLLDGSISTTHLGSASNFVRFLGQNATYHRFSQHLIFARNTQFGVETSYGPGQQVSAPGTLFTNQIPLAERFFAGGGDSLRSFSLDQAGPRDPATGYPIGGNALFVNSLELRMPFHGGRYGVVVFNDAGNVYSSLSEMRLLKFVQSSPADLNYDVDAMGIGFRYKTPIGPVRLDLSYGLNIPRYQIVPQTGPVEVLRLPAFQYFISIGQSF